MSATGDLQPGWDADAGALVPVPQWVASTAYVKGQQVSSGNPIYARLTAGTSASTWAADSTNWLLLGTGAAVDGGTVT